MKVIFFIMLIQKRGSALTLFQWPPCSPDLNSTIHMYFISESRVKSISLITILTFFSLDEQDKF